MAKKETTETTWTPRSQAAILRQELLEQQREELQRRIAKRKEKIAGLEKDRERTAQRTLEPERHDSGFSLVRIDTILHELRAANDELDLWTDQLDRVEKEIEGCEPTAEQAAQRRRTQDALAETAEQRLALDQGIDAQLAQLRDLLMQRAEATGRMAILANELKLGLDLDQARFDALLASLPAQTARRSRAWAERLLGRATQPMRAYARERLVLDETLAHTGVYKVGEEVHLSEPQFAELRRADRPIVSSGPHDFTGFHPVRVFTVEEYESARREAEAKGTLLEEVIFWQDEQRWREAEEEWRRGVRGGAPARMIAR